MCKLCSCSYCCWPYHLGVRLGVVSDWQVHDFDYSVSRETDCAYSGFSRVSSGICLKSLHWVAEVRVGYNFNSHILMCFFDSQDLY